MINYIPKLTYRLGGMKLIGRADGIEEWTPGMYVYRESYLKHSFFIEDNAMWKFLDPKDNLDPLIIALDIEDFNNSVLIPHQLDLHFAKQHKVRIGEKQYRPITSEDLQKIAYERAHIYFAERLNKAERIMLCVGYNLSHYLCEINIIEKPPVPVIAALQLMLWIHDKLELIKDIPVNAIQPESTVAVGEVVMTIDGQKITKELTLNETDLLTGE
jgi:hypothetical protein